MEDSLGHIRQVQRGFGTEDVLILVVMEDSLGLFLIHGKRSMEKS